MVVLFLILSFLCWGLAAYCNSIMDTLKYHYYNSVFNKKYGNNPFWNEDLKDASPYMIPYTKYKLNAWHLFKSSMIVLQALTACFIFLVGVNIDSDTNAWLLLLDFIILLVLYGIIWNGVFNLFFNKLLVNKKP